MRRDSLHLTLAFIGAATPSQIELLHTLAGQVREPAYELVLDRLGWWPHNRIFWAGCHEAPSSQRRLFAALAEPLRAAGFSLDTRPHLPHVTLVRQARCDGLPALPAPIRWDATSFSLVESLLQPSGARYRELARWPLLTGE
jgi:2'-5' RNA ligase